MDFEHQKYLNNPDESKMKVQQGVDQPNDINNEAVKQFLSKKPHQLSANDYLQGIITGNRIVLSKAITLIESNLPKHNNLAQEIIEKCLPYSGDSIRIGITGVPGVGKSTFIETIGKYVTGLGRKLAVLAIDPSSGRSKGSILGDKTRMEKLSSDENAFIRPSPSAGSLGGVARKTRETIILCEAAGFNTIFVETVGVGQSEIAVHSMVDFFLLLMLAGAGDVFQGIKRGIMEMSDAIFINKADGDNITNANRAKAEYQSALHLFPVQESGWTPKTDICSAMSNFNIDKVWQVITDYFNLTNKNGYFRKKRGEQEKFRMMDTIMDYLNSSFFRNPEIKNKLPEWEQKVMESKTSPYKAANELIKQYQESLKSK